MIFECRTNDKIPPVPTPFPKSPHPPACIPEVSLRVSTLSHPIEM